MLKPIPLQSKLLIEPLDDAINKGGKAYAPETEKEDRKKSSQGKIVAVGSEYKGELKKGDIVNLSEVVASILINDKKAESVDEE